MRARLCSYLPVLGLLACVSSGARADAPANGPSLDNLDIPQSVKKSLNRPGTPYTQAVTHLQGYLLTFDALVALCDKRHPETQSANHAAYAQWHDSHQASIAKIQRHAQAYLLQKADGNGTVVKRIDEFMARVAQSAVDNQYADPQSLQQGCALLPTVFQGPTMDLEKTQAADLARLDAHPLP